VTSVPLVAFLLRLLAGQILFWRSVALRQRRDLLADRSGPHSSGFVIVAESVPEVCRLV
jgi:hypothetical protein